MSPIALLQEKLRQRHLRAELERSRAITNSATRREPEMPLLNAIAEAAKTSGKTGDEVMAEYVSGKASYPAIEAAIAATRKPTATLKPSPAKPSPAKPASRTPHLDRLAKLKGAARNEFYKNHREKIFAEHAITSKPNH